METAKKNKKREYYEVTYGVKGLMDWELQLSTGSRVKPYVTVVFTGGQMTGYRMAPARFTTSDPVIQALIEASHWFEKGRIYVIRRVRLELDRRGTPQAPDVEVAATAPLEANAEPVAVKPRFAPAKK